MRKNKGYTLIEMIIVIAIMAILSGLSAVSISLMRKAKVQDAITTFDSQLSKIWLQTKSNATTQKNMYAVLKEAENDSYSLIIYDSDSTGTIKEKEKTELKKWSKYVTITYEDVGSNQIEAGYGDSTNGFYIKFDKATGAVLKGAGKYTFRGKDGAVAATVYLDAATGNHYIK